ncbi:MAG: DUF6340 family protein [Prolixibacteraceae bacterium]|nr:DUF6340 family protein [Prolixibacteraceae bacterium]
MARSHFLYIFLIIITASTLSCTQFRSLTIENQYPPKVKIPEEIQSLTLMNRAMTNEFLNFNEDSLQRYFYRKDFMVNINVLDSLAADTCLKALGDLLFESGRFDVVIPVERNIPRDSKYYIIEQPLGWDYVDEICKTYNTDALLVMEKFVTRVGSRFEAEVEELYSDRTAYSYFYASFDVIYNSFFRIYDPVKKEISGQIFITDTIFWENGDMDQHALFKKLGTIKRGLIDTGIKVALDLDGYLSPSWVPAERGIFIIDKKNATEKKLIEANNWEQLTAYWQPLTESRNKFIRSKAEYNMALACELDGRTGDAISWASKSYKSLFRNQTDSYLKKLKLRKAELIRMEQQNETD